MKQLLFILLLLFPLPTKAQPGIITTIAGNGGGTSTGDSSLADSASLIPWGIAVNKHGTIFVSDNYYNKIRKFTEGGNIYTYIGNGYPGYTGATGPASAAQLNASYHITFDTVGNLYIADAGNYIVWKVNTHDTISIYAGNHTPGYYSGTGILATSAKVGATGVGADTHGNLFIADGDTRVRRVDAADSIFDFAGNGSVGYGGDGGAALSAAFDGTVAVCADAAGNVYIADQNNSIVRKVNTAGVVSRFAGTTSFAFSGDGGQATAAAINGPNDVKADAYGNVYIVDKGNNRIRKVSPSGIITTIAGNGSAGFSGDGGPATAASLHYPTAMWINDSGDIYIADWGNKRVRKIGHPAYTGLGTSSIPLNEGKLRVYPNPSTGTITIETDELKGKGSLEIFNAAGEKVYWRMMVTNSIQISLQQPVGTYFVKLRMGQQTLTQTILIEK